MKKEKHHITPKCLLRHKTTEFINSPSNLIEVTREDHTSLHKWLYRLTGELSCEVAYLMMSGQNTHPTEVPGVIDKISSKAKEQWANIANRDAQSKRTKEYLRLHPDRLEQMIQTLRDNPITSLSKETRKKLSDITKKQWDNPTHREKVSSINKIVMNVLWKDAEFVERHKEGLNNFLDKRSRVCCVYCKKELYLNNFKQYHGDNCSKHPTRGHYNLQLRKISAAKRYISE